MSFQRLSGRVRGCSPAGEEPGSGQKSQNPKIPKRNGKMSLFHKTEENAAPVTFTDKEAVVALLFLTVTAVQRVRDAIDAKGRAEVFEAGVRALPPELKQTVYTLAGDIVFADGTASPEEMTFLREVQEALEVPDELATKVIEVMRIKNCG